MPKIEEQIDINVARLDVFRYCHDLSSWSDWDEQVKFAELISPKPVRQGTLLRIDAQHPGGAIFTWEAEYLQYQMPDGSTISALDTAPSSPFAAGSTLAWDFNTIDGSTTRVKWTWEYKPRGFFANVLDKLGRGNATQRAMRRSLAKLKEALESGRRAKIG